MSTSSLAKTPMSALRDRLLDSSRRAEPWSFVHPASCSALSGERPQTRSRSWHQTDIIIAIVQLDQAGRSPSGTQSGCSPDPGVTGVFQFLAIWSVQQAGNPGGCIPLAATAVLLGAIMISAMTPVEEWICRRFLIRRRCIGSTTIGDPLYPDSSARCVPGPLRSLSQWQYGFLHVHLGRSSARRRKYT